MNREWIGWNDVDSVTCQGALCVKAMNVRKNKKGQPVVTKGLSCVQHFGRRKDSEVLVKEWLGEQEEEEGPSGKLQDTLNLYAQSKAMLPTPCKPQGASTGIRSPMVLSGAVVVEGTRLGNEVGVEANGTTYPTIQHPMRALFHHQDSLGETTARGDGGRPPLPEL